jgi:hypothetical protein
MALSASNSLIFAFAMAILYMDTAVQPEFERVETKFGYVLVHPLDVPAAIIEGEAAQLRAKQVFRLEEGKFAIVEENINDTKWGDINTGTITYVWSFPNGLKRFKPRPAINLLRHEIGHNLFALYMAPTSTKDQYGTDVPDWLDEMAAIAFESKERRLSRRGDIEQKQLLPLSKLLGMIHPESGSTVVIKKGETFATSTTTSDQTIPFYTTIAGFYDFLVAKTEEESIVAELANAFTQGEDLEPWLLNRLGYGAQANSLAQMNGDFQEWFARNS